MFHELDVVKVVNLLDAHRHFDGSKSDMRSPCVGDIGTVVFIHSDNHGVPNGYIVECVNDEGLTIWLADFSAEELEMA